MRHIKAKDCFYSGGNKIKEGDKVMWNSIEGIITKETAVYDRSDVEMEFLVLKGEGYDGVHVTEYSAQFMTRV